MKTQKECFSTTTSLGTALGGSITTNLNQWNTPYLVSVREEGESIVFIYKQTSSIYFTTYPASWPTPRVFKIVYSCVDGKWNKSEPVYGEIVPVRDEDYEFE